MPKFYMEQGGGGAIYLEGDHADATAADLYANSIGIFGTPVEASVWESGPEVAGVMLEDAKQRKQVELYVEATSRVGAVTGNIFRDPLAAFMLDVLVKNNSLENVGKDVADIGGVYGAAHATIAGLPDIAAVDAYDVVTDPGWP